MSIYQNEDDFITIAGLIGIAVVLFVVVVVVCT